MGAEEKLKFTCNKNDCDTWAGGEIQTVATNENNKLNSGEQGQRRQRRLSIPSGRLKDLQCHLPQSFSNLPNPTHYPIQSLRRLGINIQPSDSSGLIINRQVQLWRISSRRQWNRHFSVGMDLFVGKDMAQLRPDERQVVRLIRNKGVQRIILMWA